MSKVELQLDVSAMDVGCSSASFASASVPCCSEFLGTFLTLTCFIKTKVDDLSTTIYRSMRPDFRPLPVSVL